MNKKLLLVPGYLVGCGGLALITYRTVLAFSTSSKAIMVQVNRYGEQYLDLVALGLLWVVCIVGLWALRHLVTERDRGTKTTEAELGATKHTGSSFFLDKDQDAGMERSFGLLPADAAGYVYLDEARTSTASVSVMILQQNLPEAF